MNAAQAAPGEGEVFLTGASGFVGSHVLAALLAGGYRVRALVRGPWDAPPGVVSVAGDLHAPGALIPALRDCRYVIHTAALYSFAPRDRSAFLSTLDQTIRRIQRQRASQPAQEKS